MFMTWEVLFPHSFESYVSCMKAEFSPLTQLSFLGPNMASSQPSSLSGPFVPMVSSLPRVNYVATSSMPTSTDDQFSDVVHHVLGALEPDLSFMTSYEL